MESGTIFGGYRIDSVPAGAAWASSTAPSSCASPHVALKVISPELAARRRIPRRASSASRELAASLDHPNVVPIYEAGEDDGRLFIAMRYVEGTDLRALLDARAARSSPRAPRGSSRRSARRSTPRTGAGSCTATSSRRTSCIDGRTARSTPTSPTSA